MSLQTFFDNFALLADSPNGVAKLRELILDLAIQGKLVSQYENEGLSRKAIDEGGRLAPSGSILMVCIGTIGKVNVIERDCSFNQQINSLTPYSDLNPYLFNYFLRSGYFQSEAWRKASRTTI